MEDDNLCYQPIGVLHSCYKERFVIPRQAGIVPSAKGELEIYPAYAVMEAFRELDDFSHLWLIWAFHQQQQRKSWRPTVRPPRLGGRQRRGVFATRSPFRPNPIGLSVVRLEAIRQQGSSIVLELSGIDMLDGTPVLDIKPYLPYSDRIADARVNFAIHPPARTEVVFSPEINEKIARLEADSYPGLRELLRDTLALNPRSSRQPDKDRFGTRLYDLEVHWKNDRKGHIIVVDIERILS